MAYASAVALTVLEIVRAGKSLDKLAVTPTATHGNKFLNDGKTFLFVRNGSVGDITVTFDAVGAVDGMNIADLVVTVKATGDGDGLDELMIGPFPSIFNQSDSYVWAVFSAVTSITTAAFRLANP